jgi:hypothetical protein
MGRKFDAGAPSIGFNITLPKEQELNRYSTPEPVPLFRNAQDAMRANRW